MASDPSFIEHVLECSSLEGRLVARKMFGDYGFHLDGKFIALGCENSFYIKATEALDKHGLDLPMGPPYPGAKDYPIADELLDDPELFRQVLLDTLACLPAPKPKRKKKARKKAAAKRPRR